MIYDLRTAVCVKTLEGHAAPISCVLFDSNGSHLASFSEGDMTLRVWKVQIYSLYQYYNIILDSRILWQCYRLGRKI